VLAKSSTPLIAAANPFRQAKLDQSCERGFDVGRQAIADTGLATAVRWLGVALLEPAAPTLAGSPRRSGFSDPPPRYPGRAPWRAGPRSGLRAAVRGRDATTRSRPSGNLKSFPRATKASGFGNQRLGQHSAGRRQNRRAESQSMVAAVAPWYIERSQRRTGDLGGQRGNAGSDETVGKKAGRGHAR
jgi:hypothetical protein